MGKGRISSGFGLWTGQSGLPRPNLRAIAREGASGSPCVALGPEIDRAVAMTARRGGDPADGVPVARRVFESCVGKMVDVLVGEKRGDFYTIPNADEPHDHAREFWRGILVSAPMGLVAEGCVVLRHLEPVEIADAWVYEFAAQAVGARWNAANTGVKGAVLPSSVIVMRPSQSWDPRFKAQNQLMKGAFL